MNLLKKILGRLHEFSLVAPILGPIQRRISFFRYPYNQQKYELFKRDQINLALDVGAHIGEYGLGLRHIGYKGRIISFEPVQDAFTKLQKRSKRYPDWICYNYALGDKEEERSIHILSCRPASSFLKATDQFIKDYSSLTKNIREEQVSVKRLDQMIQTHCKKSDRVFLKIDTQGYERKILESAGNYLKQMTLVEVEVSLIELYENETLLAEMVQFMSQKGFTLIGISPHKHHAESLQQHQADILFSHQ